VAPCPRVFPQRAAVTTGAAASPVWYDKLDWLAHTHDPAQSCSSEGALALLLCAMQWQHG